MSSPIVYWFTSEVYPWRTTAATCWAMLSVPVFSIAFVLLTGISFSHPVQWISDTAGVMISSQFFTSVLVFALLLALVTRFSFSHYSVIADIEKTRLNSVLSLFRWSRLPLLVVSFVTGAVSSWSLLRLMGSDMGSLTYELDSKEFRKVMLNERHLFLVEAGVFFSLCHFVRFFWQKQNYLSFPHIQRQKFFLIRREASRILHSNAGLSVKNTLCFYAVYFLFGGGPKLWIKSSFNMNEDSSKSDLTSVLGLLDISLFWQTYVLSLILTTAWTLATSLLRVFHTQLLQFDIQSAMEAKQDRGLGDAMATSEPQLLQHLAFYDFCLLSRHSKQRRQELFSLSQPGGHPRVWMAVSRTALHIARELTLKIQDANRLIMSRVAVAGQNQMANEEVSKSPFLFSSNLDSDGANSKGDPSNNNQTEAQASHSLSKIKATLSSLPFITQLTAENPDTDSRCLFASCQMHMWAVEGLSQVASWSFTEDKYGVVQGFLPTLIYTLVDLNEAIEKHFKCTSVVRRSHAASEDVPDASLPHRLHSVTRTAIYRVVNTYRQHLHDLHLSPEYFKKVQMFSDFLL
ncbi:nucleoporin NDC1 isoform X1 [Aplysia californica]|uniref:Nucleoporin NDC1 isoform X1 n=1 Tax=Aplysia californica TaxID=6500 RepID=A0ABM0JXI7_APLCA|nr:nucleoporin NDC1 isoform X1 [Aplysia californica]